MKELILLWIVLYVFVSWNLQMNDLMEIPSDKSVFTITRIISSVAIAVAGTAIVSGILLARR